MGIKESVLGGLGEPDVPLSLRTWFEHIITACESDIIQDHDSN